MSDNPQGSISTQITIPLVPNSAEWLEAALTKHFKIPSLRDFQLHHSLQIINGSDLMLMIATGQGKTVVLLAGLVAAHERGENAICIYVAPTKALVEQQVWNLQLISDIYLTLSRLSVRPALSNRSRLTKIHSGPPLRENETSCAI